MSQNRPPVTAARKLLGRAYGVAAVVGAAIVAVTAVFVSRIAELVGDRRQRYGRRHVESHAGAGQYRAERTVRPWSAVLRRRRATVSSAAESTSGWRLARVMTATKSWRAWSSTVRVTVDDDRTLSDAVETVTQHPRPSGSDREQVPRRLVLVAREPAGGKADTSAPGSRRSSGRRADGGATYGWPGRSDRRRGADPMGI